MLQKLKRLGSYLIIIVLLPYVITVFMNGQAVPASKTVDTMQVKAERDGKEMDVPLEDYCIGRMAKEIPVSYEKEALRAQAHRLRIMEVRRYSMMDTGQMMTCVSSGDLEAIGRIITV